LEAFGADPLLLLKKRQQQAPLVGVLTSNPHRLFAGQRLTEVGQLQTEPAVSQQPGTENLKKVLEINQKLRVIYDQRE
jgi:hypothetical protein